MAGSAKGIVLRSAITATSGTTEIIDLSAGECIQVLSLVITTDADVNIKFQSDETDLTGLYYLAARGGISFPHEPFHMLTTSVGEKLNLVQSGAANIGGHVVYVVGGPSSLAGRLR